MNYFKRLLFCLALGSFALTLSCGEEEKEETTTETPTETPATTCGDGTCDADETTESCAADCPAAAPASALCAGDSDTAYRDAVAGGTGLWDDADCAGNLQNDACVMGGMVGAAVACQAGTNETTCTALGECMWLEDECFSASLITCAMAETAEACGGAGCNWDAEDESCMPASTEPNCTAATSVLAAQGVSCSWNSDFNFCLSPKKGSDLASASAATCGFGCLSDSDPVTCSIACMKGEDQLGTALTDGCLTCYAGVLGCVLDNCLLQCSATQSKCDAECSDECEAALTECSTCRATAGCTSAFDLCADGPATEG